MRLVLTRRLAPLDGPLAFAALYAGAIGLAVALGGVLFLLFHADPLAAYLALISSAFLEWRGFGYTLVQATPLILVSLGTIVAWRSGFIYLGFEGALVVAAAAATAVALAAGPGGPLAALPGPGVIALALLAGAAAGMAWSMIVALLQVRTGGNAVLLALMTNYLAVLLVQFLVSGPMRAAGDQPQTALIDRAFWLPIVIEGTRAHAGILIALVLAIAVFLLMEKTAAGFELVAAGLNPRAARYGGIDVDRRILLAAIIAGALAGLAGAIDILGVHHRLLDGLSQGTGFVGIVAALLGRMTVPGSVVASLLYSGLTVGAEATQRHTGLPSAVIQVVQALIVLCLLGAEILRSHRLALVRSRPPRGAA
ncbi:ABC transporter permease [Labrys wisconsinensis]|uniref:Simple sugar transport system permease protein n=1 Tax=Labrys wisconsinensis TaxID=425677 RepID=A0ABU0J1Q6_9HYPH|nr:ABC transporter permease [Labrys wisconsinensis]MDQ0468183.1 simple sugar transport system permease protein [Labrys wisconsinensis]